MAGRTPGPLRLPDGFWARPDVLEALGQRDFTALFCLLSKYAGASQTQIAIAVGLTQGQVSTAMAGKRRLTSINVVERALDGLDAPDAARAAAGLAPRRHAGRDTWESATREKATDDSVYRRNLLQLGGLAAVGVATAMRPGAANPLADVARALTSYSALMDNEPSAGPAPTVAALDKAVASAKRNYQACRYAAVLNELPPLLRAVQIARATVTGDELQRVHGLAADAYQVTGSVMLKLGDSGLAALAADRSMDAADHSEDPVVLAASARIVTHSLMSGGHTGRAAEVATRAAEHLDHVLRTPSPEAISVYGALLLRGSIAAAKDENRTDAVQLLDEAEDAAQRLGQDANAHWTGFGPTNVALHRVNVALELGDAGTAIDLARQVDVRRIELAERKAALFIDMAQAFLQWKRHEKAYHALRMAEQVAPEEVRTRRAVHALVEDLAHQAPRSARSRICEFAQQIGAEV
jgi:tetratricopeptide (TPR) repeat protein